MHIYNSFLNHSGDLVTKRSRKLEDFVLELQEKDDCFKKHAEICDAATWDALELGNFVYFRIISWIYRLKGKREKDYCSLSTVRVT